VSGEVGAGNLIVYLPQYYYGVASLRVCAQRVFFGASKAPRGLISFTKIDTTRYLSTGPSLTPLDTPIMTALQNWPIGATTKSF